MSIFKNSSVVTVWELTTETGVHTVELSDNELTGTRCFNIDHKEILCDTSFLFSKAFDYTFDLDDHKCEINIKYETGPHYAQSLTGHLKMDGEEIQPAFIKHS